MFENMPSPFSQPQANSLRVPSYGVGLEDNRNMGGVQTEISGERGYLSSSVGDELNLPRQRMEGPVGIDSAVPPELMSERSSFLRCSNGPTTGLKGESNMLFVDGLPTDCTRREVGHLFRPFFGYKDIKVVHKEPRKDGDKAMVLCFVEFIDAKCAMTAKDALLGYKFDDKKPDSPTLRIHFAHFPFRLPSDQDDQRTEMP